MNTAPPSVTSDGTYTEVSTSVTLSGGEVKRALGSAVFEDCAGGEVAQSSIGVLGDTNRSGVLRWGTPLDVKRSVELGVCGEKVSLTGRSQWERVPPLIMEAPGASLSIHE